MHFAWLDALTMLVNNPINIFLINPSIISFFSLNIYGYLKY